jgi:hypothetical protein
LYEPYKMSVQLDIYFIRPHIASLKLSNRFYFNLVFESTEIIENVYFERNWWLNWNELVIVCTHCVWSGNKNSNSASGQVLCDLLQNRKFPIVHVYSRMTVISWGRIWNNNFSFWQDNFQLILAMNERAPLFSVSYLCKYFYSMMILRLAHRVVIFQQLTVMYMHTPVRSMSWMYIKIAIIAK